MKNIRIVHGTLMYPLEVGSRALIFEEGRYLHTSTVIAIHGVTPQQIRFETMNSHYCLLAPSSPVASRRRKNGEYWLHLCRMLGTLSKRINIWTGGYGAYDVSISHHERPY